MAWSQKGEQYLVDISRQEIQQMYKKEKNHKAQLRLLAAILRKEGKTIEEISTTLQKPIMTVSDWIRRIENNGIGSIYNKKQPGKPARLTKDQLEQLKEILAKSPQKQDLPFKFWTTKLVQYIVCKLFSVHYQLWNLRRIIKKLGFVLKVPRQRNYKANTKAQEEFKKKFEKKFNTTLSWDSRSSVLMKPTLKWNPMSQRAGSQGEANPLS